MCLCLCLFSLTNDPFECVICCHQLGMMIFVVIFILVAIAVTVAIIAVYENYDDDGDGHDN